MWLSLGQQEGRRYCLYGSRAFIYSNTKHTNQRISCKVVEGILFWSAGPAKIHRALAVVWSPPTSHLSYATRCSVSTRVSTVSELALNNLYNAVIYFSRLSSLRVAVQLHIDCLMLDSARVEMRFCVFVFCHLATALARTAWFKRA
jgi:hypothetical protein